MREGMWKLPDPVEGYGAPGRRLKKTLWQAAEGAVYHQW